MARPANWHATHKDRLSFGDRAADVLRNTMGSWAFVFGFLGFMAVWMTLNVVAWFWHWDEYPFILLNLGLSMLAGLQGAILLIAAKRQDAIASEMARHDYDTNVAAEREVRALLKIAAAQHELLKAVHANTKKDDQ